MALTFPNLSRSYDAVGKRIRFFGYDGMFQISFFIPVEAISRKTPEAAHARTDVGRFLIGPRMAGLDFSALPFTFGNASVFNPEALRRTFEVWDVHPPRLRNHAELRAADSDVYAG